MPRSPEQYQPGDIVIIPPGTELSFGTHEDHDDPLKTTKPTKVLITGPLVDNAYPVRFYSVEDGKEILVDEPRFWHQPEP